MTELVLCDVSRRYGAALAIDSLNLTVSEGEFLTLLGPSGCGKSTTLASIAGLDQPTGGRITFGDRVLVDADTGAYLPPEARGFGVVFQSYALWPHMTVENNVAMSLKLRKVPSAERKKRVAEALDLVELGGLAKRYPGELSGGQQQRVALARMLANDPAVILADQPTGNLDPRTGGTVVELMEELNREASTTLVLVTHDLELAGRAHRTLVLGRGGFVSDTRGQAAPPPPAKLTKAQRRTLSRKRKAAAVAAGCAAVPRSVGPAALPLPAPG